MRLADLVSQLSVMAPAVGSASPSVAASPSVTSAAEEQARADRMAEELALGRSFGIQARVRPATAVRVSGLSARSWGDGRSRASVVHLQLVTAWSHGRIQRSEGSWLCHQRVPWDRSPQAITTAITCPACLRQLARLRSGRA
jgi:hypothetical protein